MLRETREKVIQEESKGSWSPSDRNKKSQMSSSGGNKSTLIEKELKQLEKIKFKQQKEIEQTIQYELKMQ
jgi:hypothetical protein